MSFHKSVNQRLESLTSFEDTIQYINSLNDIILHLLEKRSKYPVCSDLFDSSGKRSRQKVLEEDSVDTVWWHPVYSKIVEKICQKGEFTGDDRYKLIETEVNLERFVYERIMIGRKVAEYKKPRGKEIERKEREEEIYEYVREQAPNYNLDPDSVEDIFRFIMDKNKHIQSLYKPVKSDDLKEIRSCKTQGMDSVEKIKQSFKSHGKMLSERTGNQYHVIVKEVPPYSIVKLLEE